MDPFQKAVVRRVQAELPNFRVDRYRMYGEEKELTKVVEIQFINLPDDKKAFTIHFGVYMDILYRILWDQSRPRSIEASTCSFFCNIASVMNNFQGAPMVKYWDLEVTPQLLDEIASVIETKVHLLCNRITTPQDLNTILNSTDFPAKFIATYPVLNCALKLVLGKIEEFSGLRDLLHQRDEQYYRPQIEDLIQRARAHGFEIPEVL